MAVPAKPHIRMSGAESPYYGGQFVVEEPPQDARRQVRFESQDRSPALKLAPQASPLAGHSCRAPSPAPPRSAQSPNHPHRHSRPWKCSKCLWHYIKFYILFIVCASVAFLWSRPTFGRAVSRQLTSRFRYLYHASSGLHTSITPDLARHIEGVVDNAVQEALLRQVGRLDHALAVDGARIVARLTSGDVSLPKLIGHPAEALLRDNTHGGRCWEVAGSHGQVAVATRSRLRPTHVTVDYLPREIPGEARAAPRRMRLWGMLELEGQESDWALVLQPNSNVIQGPGVGPPISEDYTWLHLADFEYDIAVRSYSQTFPVSQHLENADINFGVFVFEVVDNWGGDTTSICRLRIHRSF